MSVQLKNISFRYDGQSENIIDNLSVSFNKGFTAIIGANGLGKTTLVNIIAGYLKPDSGSLEFINKYYSIAFLKQDSYKIPDNFSAIFEDSKNAGYIRSLLNIDATFYNRYDTLSFGERKRVQIASVLIQMPDILILDEITNHIDDECKKILINALRQFNGVCILISHDRDFLDSLANNCLFIREQAITMRAGKYSDCLENEKMENEYKLKLYEKSKSDVKKFEKRYKETKDKAERKREQSFSKRGIDKKDHDAKGKVDAARLTGKDSKMSGKVSNIHSLYNKSIEEKNSLYYREEKSLSLYFVGECAKNKILFNNQAGKIILNENKELITRELTIRNNSKIGLFGYNGAGKSSLIKYILNNISIDENKILYIPQEIDSKSWSEIYKQTELLDKSDFGLIISMIDRLGSNAKAVLASSSHSPGEIRKLMLAMGLLKKPNIVIMDEPTNHLDISSIERLEDSLKSFNSALLLVSHDKIFLDNIVSEKWVFSKSGKNSILTIEDNL